MYYSHLFVGINILIVTKVYLQCEANFRKFTCGYILWMISFNMYVYFSHYYVIGTDLNWGTFI